jgi:hypothetical protein
LAVEVLREHLERQAAPRRRAGVLWEDNGLVFTSARDTTRCGRCAPVAPDDLWA